MTDGEHETNSTGDAAPAYLRAIELHREHPVVKHWFHQITPCELLIPGQGSATFLMIEFRDGNLAAMVWGDGQGNWGTGGWRPLSAKRVMDVDIAYLQDAPAARSFTDILDMVAARRQEIATAPSPARRWWRFWR
jgi:hypothetical protein